MPSISNAYRGCRTPWTAPPMVRAEPVTATTSAGVGRKFIESEDKRLLDLRAEGLKWTEIARAIGRPSNSCIDRWRRLNGLPR